MQAFHHDRISRLQARLPLYQVDVLVIEDSVNLYYLTGCDLSAGTLLIEGDKFSLLVDGRYLTACRQELPESSVYFMNDEQLKALLHLPSLSTISIDADEMTVGRYSYYQQMCATHQRLVHLHSPLSPLRSVKDSTELDLLRAAAKLGSLGYDYVVSLLQAGCQEEELAIALEVFWRQKGAQGIAFSPIIAFGANSALPHYHTNRGILQPNDCALIDIGVKWRYYHSDMTRTLLLGHPDSRLRNIHAVVHEAQQAALNLCRPGVTAGTLDNAARCVIERHGYGEYFTHSLGHGVGLEIHEAPRLSNKESHAAVVLEENTVVTIEPGIYLPGLGGVRLENTIVITEQGYQDLTQRP